MQPETIWLILAVDEVDEVLSLIFIGSIKKGYQNRGNYAYDVVCKFCENSFAFVFCKGTHCKVEVSWSEP
jgi:hypothetical protein